MKITEDFSKKDFFQRLRQLRISYAGERGKKIFARAIGLSASTYSYYERGRLPPVDVLVRIAKLMDVDMNWLLTGKTDAESPVFGKNSAPSSKPEISRKSTGSLVKNVKNLMSEDPDTAELLAAFVSLIRRKESLEQSMPDRPLQTSDLPTGADFDKKRQDLTSAEQIDKDQDSESGWIPVLGRTAAGFIHCWKEHIPEPSRAATELNDIVCRHLGRSILAYDYAQLQMEGKSKSIMAGLRQAPANLVQIAGRGPDEIVEFLDCPSVRKICPDCFALRIDGDSMAPRIQDGDFVLLSPSAPAGQADVAVLQVRGQIGLTCKLVRYDKRKVHLVPFNEKYQTKVVNAGQLLWALVVLGHVRLKQA